MIGLGLALPLPQTRDSTLGGTADVWEWENGVGMLWETALLISLD